MRRRGLEERLLRVRGPVLLLIVLATILAAGAYSTFEIENRVDAWFDPTDPDYLRYRKTRDTFGAQEQIFIVVHADDLFTVDVLDRIDRLTRRMEAVQEVARTVSLTNVEDIVGTADGVDIGPLVPRESLLDYADDSALRALERRVLADPFFPGVVVSRDGRSTIVMCDLRDATAQSTAAVVTAAEAAMADIARPGLVLHLAGWPAVNELLDDLTQRDVTAGLPLMIVILGVGIAAAFRSVVAVLLIDVGVLLVVCWTMGAFAASGLRGTFLTISALPIILLTLTLATGVHVVARFQEERTTAPDLRAAFLGTLRAVGVPVLLSSATTAIGFGSLMIAPLPPVRHLGLFAALGMFFVCIVCLSVLPFGLMALPPRTTRGTAEGLTGFLGRVADINGRHHRLVLAMAALLGVGAVMGMTRLRPQGNGLGYMPTSSPPYQAMRFIEDQFGGASDVEVVIDGPHGVLLDPGVARLVMKVQALLERFRETGATMAYTDLLRRMHRALNDGDPAQYRVPDTRDAIAQELFLYEGSGGSELATWLDPSTYGHARVTAYATSFQTIEEDGAFYAALQRGLATLERPPGVTLDVALTGDGPLWYRVNTSLLGTMLKSLLLSFLGVSSIMILLMRSVRLGLLAMVPNLLPVLLAVGGMGWAGIRLDFATVMVAGISLGMAVDDTIHYLARYRAELAVDGDSDAAMRRTLLSVGRAMVTTTLVLFCGFGLMVLSSFPPHRTFGIVLALTMLVALAGDLFLLPALIKVASRIR